jgi:transcriptional regulator with XRE-family HTH domain
MDRNMLAKDIARQIGVTESTVLNWERAVYKQLLSPVYLRKIKAMTGLDFHYNPKDRRKNKPAPGSLGEKLRNKRLELGLTLKELSKILEISVATLVCLESPTHQREMLAKNKEKIERFCRNKSSHY